MTDVRVETEPTTDSAAEPFVTRMEIAPDALHEPFPVFVAALNWELKRQQAEALLWWQEGRIELRKKGEL